jgi:exopolysaccharide biosynthesis polyprenyl glycosylphosphotransferase
MANQPNFQKPAAARLGATELRLILIVGDLLVSVLALLMALYLWAQRDQWLNFSWKFLEERPQPWYWFLPLVWLLLINEIYDLRRASRRGDTVRSILAGVVVGFGLYLVVFFLSPVGDSLPRIGVAAFLAFTAILTLVWRMIYIRIFTAPQFLRRVLVVGAGRAGSTLCAVIAGLKPQPFHTVGLVDDDPQKAGMLVNSFPVLGCSTSLEEIINKHGVTDIIFAISGEMRPETFQALLDAQESGVEIRSLASVYEELLGRVPIFLLQSDWILRSFVDQARTNALYEAVKRVIDVVGGLFGAVVLVFLFPAVALLIIAETGWPVMFTQKRLGKNGQEYKIIKFRTMVHNADKLKARVTTSHDDRITRVGRVLRKSHLDEWPQFLNVLNGEMSLVGPRAEQSDLVLQLQTNIPFYRARLLVKPGITGWAQVNFGYASTVEDTGIKLEYDLYYIKHRTLLLDIVIMLRTFGTIVGFRGQ